MKTYTHAEARALVYDVHCRALLDTLASGESGSGDGMHGYGTYVYNYAHFDPTVLADHPTLVDPTLFPYRPAGRDITSAAGRYQFVASTWKEEGWTGQGFSPLVQDAAVIRRASQSFRDFSVQRLRAEARPSRETLAKVHAALQPEWAALADPRLLPLAVFTERYYHYFDLWRSHESAGTLRAEVAKLHAVRFPHDGWYKRFTKDDPPPKKRRAGDAPPPLPAADAPALPSPAGSADASSADASSADVRQGREARLPEARTMLEQLMVLAGEETAALQTPPPPVEGEFDLGDIRFGSVLVMPGSRQTGDIFDPAQNQPAGVVQQNAGTVGLVELLRTPMNAVLADNRILPEVLVELKVNATYRDDVNRMLRPLIALSKRCPFVPVRNADVARLMLGLGPDRTAEDVLAAESPELYAELARSEEALAALRAQTPSDIWVPVTIRSVALQSQAAAPGLYHVTLTLMQANVAPYVPRLAFFRRTESALAWAQHLSHRSVTGTTVVEQSADGARTVTPDGTVVRVDTAIGAQTESPYESYPFKKFWRGLLEEFQPHSYRAAAEQPWVHPIGRSAEGGDVYEPAYPIADERRMLETYDARAPLSLAFITAADVQTRAHRARRLDEAFSREARRIETLAATAELFATGAEADGRTFMPELGKMPAVQAAISRELTLAMLAAGVTIESLARQIDIAITDAAGRVGLADWRDYELVRDGARVVVRRTMGEAPTGRAAGAEQALSRVATSAVRHARFLDAAGVADFIVAAPGTPDMGMTYTEVTQKLQVALLSKYAAILDALDRQAAAGTPLRAFLDASEAREEKEPGYLLSLAFFEALKGQAGVPADARAALARLVEATARLSRALADQLDALRRERAERSLAGMTRLERGALAFDRSTVESVVVRLSQRFADRPWDGYAHPVTQHLGGMNAEVSLQIETDDIVLLAQLSQLKMSQTALAELRKSRDVVPPVMDVEGRGSLLRALGIYQLAYRAHTMTMAEDRPGFYRIRLDLLQDEDMLRSAERLTRETGVGGVYYLTRETLPLFVPVLAGGAAKGGGGSSLFEGARPLSARHVLERVYGAHLGWTPAPAPGAFDEPEFKGGRAFTHVGGSVEPRRLADAYRPLMCDVRYRRPAERTATSGSDRRALEITLQTGDGGGGRLTLAPDLDDVLAGVVSLLDFIEARYGALAEDEQTEAALFIGDVERLLASSVVPDLIRLSAQVVALEKTPQVWQRPAELAGDFGVVRRRAPADDPAAYGLATNVTLTVHRVLSGQEGASPLDAAALRGLRAAADAVTRRLLRSARLRALYDEWTLGLKAWPYAETPITPAGERLTALAAAVLDKARRLPGCYPDLCMPEVRDPLLHLNIMGYDFPYGPGTTALVEDVYLRDYERAEAERAVLALEAATIGLSELRRDAERGGAAWEERRRYYDRVAETIRLVKGEEAAPTLAARLSELEAAGAFDAAVPARHLTHGQLFALARTAATLEYATLLADLARTNAPELAEAALLDLRGELDPMGELFAGGRPVTNTLGLASFSARLQEDPILAKKRAELIRLYQGDPETLAQLWHYSDPTAELYRKRLMDQVAAQWVRPIGMRRAFPSYALMIVGPVGSPSHWLLSDVYSYAAVQRLEVRKQADAAGHYCSLVLSNVRSRLSDPTERERYLMLDAELGETQIEVRPGTHMHVYVGYGPDVAHLSGFAGRVVSVVPGAVMQVELASYSATLSNPPLGGEGFYAAGSDGLHTLSEYLLYTITQTEGLEGLGRGTLAALDARGLVPRGDEYSDVEASVMIALYRGLLSPFAGRLYRGDARREDVLRQFKDLYGRIGLDGLRELITGNPRLYENLQIAAPGADPKNFVDFLFSGLPDVLSSGNGFTWVAEPGQTTFSILRELALLFPNYVVAARPYNEGVPYSELAQHPLRQTLYFGPKSGSYVATSTPVRLASGYSDYVEKNIRRLLYLYHSRPGEVENLSEQQIARLGTFFDVVGGVYRDVFVRALISTCIFEYSNATGEPGWLTDPASKIRIVFDRIFSPLAGPERTLLNSPFYSFRLDEKTERTIRARLESSFPATMRAHDAFVEATGRTTAFWLGRLDEAFGGRGLVTMERFLRLFTLDEAEARSAAGAAFLDAFLDDLARLALEPHRFANLQSFTPGAERQSANELLEWLHARAISEGYFPTTEVRPFTEHHVASVYAELVSNRVRAAADSPDFANTVTLQFPRKADEDRLSPFQDPRRLYAYTVKASPLIHPDAVRAETVYYANLNYNWSEAFGVFAAQDASPEGEEGPLGLMLRAQRVREELEALRADGARAQQARLAELEREYQALIERLRRTPYVMPKYQTVAHNILQDRVSRMYQGELVLAGSPRIEPYHIVHVWDDAKQMHGPVEVDSVLHAFGPDGFHTVVLPRLVTQHRGLDETVDTMWLSQTSEFYHLYVLLTRGLALGSAGITAFTLSPLLSKAGAAISAKLGAGAGAAAGTILSVAGLAYVAYAATRNQQRYYVGRLAETTSANPIHFIPLTLRGRPLVAGLDGAVGPSTIRASVASAVERAVERGDMTSFVEYISSILAAQHLGR